MALAEANIEDKSIVDRMREAEGPQLGISMEEIMLEIMRLLPEENYVGLRELRLAYRAFESKNPGRGSDDELDRLVDRNLYFLCDIADKFRETPQDLPYSERVSRALRAAVKEPPNISGLVTLFYETATGYRPDSESKLPMDQLERLKVYRGLRSQGKLEN